MDSQISSARLVKLYQILFLQLNKFICELEPRYVISNFRNISENTALSLEAAINRNIRYLIPTAKTCIDKLIEDLEIPLTLKELEHREVKYRALEHFEPDLEAVKFLNQVYEGKGANLPKARTALEKFKLEASEELNHLLEENKNLETQKQELYSQVYHLRQEMLSKYST